MTCTLFILFKQKTAYEMRISEWSSDVCSSDRDLMMTVPNRSLRLLDESELREYGLSGTNAVQDDLDRIILARKCGDEFVKRREIGREPRRERVCQYV